MFLYHGLVSSHLSYATVAWGTANKTLINKLQIAQNRVVRNITFTNRYTALKPLYNSLSLLNITNMIKLERGKFMHKYVHNALPSTFHNYFSEIAHTHSTRLATNFNFDLLMLRTDRGQISIKYMRAKEWNLIPTELKQIKSNTKLFRSA